MANSPGKGALFSDAELDNIILLWSQGFSATQIVKLIPTKRTRNAILGKLHRMGINKGARTQPPKPQDTVRRAKKRKAKPDAAPEPLPVPEVRALPPVALADYPGARHWLTRANGECAYPLVPDGAATISCCAPVMGSSPYCEAHKRVMYYAIPENRKCIRIP
jgi:hypothetical protein